MTSCHFITIYIYIKYFYFFSFSLNAKNNMVPFLEKRLNAEFSRPIKINEDSVIYTVVAEKNTAS